MTKLVVIPGPSQRVRPEVAGPMTGSARNPESIITILEEMFGCSSFTGRAGVMDSGPAGFARVPE
jgi:hypothetical protein